MLESAMSTVISSCSMQLGLVIRRDTASKRAALTPQAVRSTDPIATTLTS